MTHQGGVPGFIRSWVELDDVGVLIYNIAGNRWCMNVGRQHQSNGARAASLQCYTIRKPKGRQQARETHFCCP